MLGITKLIIVLNAIYFSFSRLNLYSVEPSKTDEPHHKRKNPYRDGNNDYRRVFYPKYFWKFLNLSRRLIGRIRLYDYFLKNDKAQHYLKSTQLNPLGRQ